MLGACVWYEGGTVELGAYTDGEDGVIGWLYSGSTLPCPAVDWDGVLFTPAGGRFLVALELRCDAN